MVETIVGNLTKIVGGDLRAVAEYDRNGYDLHYIRDDVDAEYTSHELEEIHDDLILEGMETERLEDLFETGKLQCHIHGFEEAFLFHFPRAEHTGLFVTIDAASDMLLPELIEGCKEIVGHPG